MSTHHRTGRAAVAFGQPAAHRSRLGPPVSWRGHRPDHRRHAGGRLRGRLLGLRHLRLPRRQRRHHRLPAAGRLTLGVWLVPAVVGGLVVRRPGAALFTELVAANVELFLGNRWGLAVLLSGAAAGPRRRAGAGRHALAPVRPGHRRARRRRGRRPGDRRATSGGPTPRTTRRPGGSSTCCAASSPAPSSPASAGGRWCATSPAPAPWTRSRPGRKSVRLPLPAEAGSPPVTAARRPRRPARASTSTAWSGGRSAGPRRSCPASASRSCPGERVLLAGPSGLGQVHPAARAGRGPHHDRER